MTTATIPHAPTAPHVHKHAHAHAASHSPDLSHGHGETMPPAIGLPNVKLCMWLFLVSEVMFFAGLIGAYIVLRFGTAGWPDPYDILAVRITAFNTFLLICSSVTMVKSFQWSDFGDRRKAMIYLALTILGGATFVGIQVYEYRHLLETPSTAMLHHVEHLMEERGLALPGHDADHEHAAAPGAGSPTIVLASMQEGGDSADLTTRQNAQLVELHSLLTEARPDVPETAAPSEKEDQHAWDLKVMQETIELAALFEGDLNRDWMVKYGTHHNLYPEGFIPSRDVFTSTFYIMTGFHGAHVAGGVIALIAIFCFYAMRRAGTMALEVVGLYWHFVDLVWIILFTIVYLM